MQAQINPSLQALLQTAQMVTPEQGPTVAKQVAQAAMQKMQAAPPGIEALLPGVQQQAAQSAQAAQPATQGDVNQLRQMMSQMAPQGQGISAGADVRMAEGGIVGYSGRDGSYVEDPETIALDELRVEEARRRREARERQERAAFLEAAGAPQAAQYAPPQVSAPSPTPSVPVPEAQAPRTGIANPRLAAARNTAAPTPPRAEPAAPAAVNPSEAALMYAQMQGGLNDLRETMSRKPAESEAEKAYRAAAMAEYQRGLGGIDAARQRMAESQQKQKDMDFINYLSGMGGGRSLFAGMRQSGQALSQAQQQREASRLAYEDKLEDRRNIVENLKLATLRQDAESARAWTNELRKNEVEISKLSIDLSKDRAGQLAITEREREKTAATAREGELGRASQERIAELNRKAQAALRNLPGPDQLRIDRAIESLMAANPGMPFHEAFNKVSGAGRPERGVMTYDQASDNVQKLLDSPSGIMEVTNIRKQAKAAGQPEPSLIEVKEMLIRREMQGAGAARSGVAAPAGGPITPKSQAEFNALPKGARYINPADGKEYTKN
jgi:hypothetical protein